MSFRPSRWLTIAFSIALLALPAASTASAQSDVFTDPFELEIGKGTWGVFLPSYNLGDLSSGESRFQDDLDDPGFIIRLNAIRRFLGTRTSMETRGWYAFAGANSLSPEGDIIFDNPGTGGTSLVSGGRGHLESNTSHYGGEFRLRDTWRTRFGGLSAGMTATYMAFDQDFEVEFGNRRLFDETLQSDFVGGKGFVGWDGALMGYRSKIDLLFGYFDVDAEYEYDGAAFAGNRRVEGGEQSGTIEIQASTRRFFNVGEVGLTLNAMYITDMPSLIQNNGPVTLGDEEAATVSAMVEWVF